MSWSTFLSTTSPLHMRSLTTHRSKKFSEAAETRKDVPSYRETGQRAEPYAHVAKQIRTNSEQATVVRHKTSIGAKLTSVCGHDPLVRMDPQFMPSDFGGHCTCSGCNNTTRTRVRSFPPSPCPSLSHTIRAFIYTTKHESM
ncbi:hypothetical protein DPEC_G00038480 [Dallia pectoralis]|uniref:Uncharacterized protein n=1 Tax=Dallia pectoralis TaxID=75939 RepID=A0ACC2HEB8_DALPE|nr:hypothetical protein DPEC_G00038480 [Dallia pectoralis]